MDNNNILIRGTGALACLFAARLAAIGIQVNMLGTWVDGLDALSRYGVRLVEPDGKIRTYLITASSNPKDFANTRFALVLVKSWQTDQAARQLSECLSEDGLALSLQNGIGNLEKLSQVLGEERVSLGVTTVGATLIAPARVHAGGEGKVFVTEAPRISVYADMLRKAGFEIVWKKDTTALIWSKLIINAAINPLAALIKVPNGELLKRKSAKKLLISTAQEVARVIEAQGIQISYSDPVAETLNTALRTAKNRSSMLQDIERGAPTEIDAICGEIVKAGEQTGVPTPINRTLWQLVLALKKE